MRGIFQKVIWVLIVSLGTAILAKMYIERHKFVLSMDKPVMLESATNLERYEGQWVRLTYECCLDTKYEYEHFGNDSKYYGVFKYPKKDNYIFAFVQEAKFEDVMNKEGNNYLELPEEIGRGAKTTATVEGKLVKLPENNLEKLRDRCLNPQDAYRLPLTEENIGFDYVLDLSPREKYEDSCQNLFIILIFAGAIWVISVGKLLFGVIESISDGTKH